ncbi:hypothetical protein GCM10009733_103330 [Nonomuraea maheshkhaliensis]|uniref:Uncharacterized protein n=1 Tax=Nonomuraea maheshkhaliensis TaxID=419590 RepID=A0ABN2HMT5_9ACTN
MEQWAKLIEAIAGLIGAVAWPVAVVLAVWLIMRRHRDAFDRLLDRLKTLTYPGGQVDFDAVAEEQQHQVEVLSKQIADSDTDDMGRRLYAQLLAEQAERLGELKYSARLQKALNAPPASSSAIQGLYENTVSPSSVNRIAEAMAKFFQDATEHTRRTLAEREESDAKDGNDGDDDPPLAVPAKR